MAVKKWAFKKRSTKSITSEAFSAGKAKTIRKEFTRTIQTNRGKRLMERPPVRRQKMVAMRLTPVPIVPTPMPSKARAQ
jgi:hypothetical protein